MVAPSNKPLNVFAYMFTGAPCLSFDVVRDAEGEGRETFPLSMLLCAGTQADTALSNRSAHFPGQPMITVCTSNYYWGLMGGIKAQLN